MEPVIRLEGAVTLLGRFPGLAGVDLEVSPQEIVLVQGPNGAGKTTLLRLCAGLLALERGRAEVLGHDLVDARRAVRPLVGLLSHESHLYHDLTVAENVRFWGRAVGAADHRLEHALERLDLAGRLRDVPVHRLSAGQRRRTSLAVLVARRPAVWLLDEPHAALDAAGRDLLDGLIVDAREAGATVLFASHEVARAVPLADRAVTMAGGVIAPPVDPEPGAGSDPPTKGAADRVP